MIQTYTNHSGTHWKKWSGRTACGAQIPRSLEESKPVDCPTCQELLASWYPDASWRINSNAPLALFDLTPGASYTFKQAREILKDLKKQMFRWKKACGFFPTFTLLMDRPEIRPVPGPAE